MENKILQFHRNLPQLKSLLANVYTRMRGKEGGREFSLYNIDSA